MRNHIRTLALALALGLATPAAADAHVSIQLGLPAVLPPLVVVQPGVQVVQDYDREIFFVGGYYWVRQDGSWYRTHNPYARWYYVRPAYVPVGLVRMPPGHYRHWHGPGWRADNRHGRGDGWDERGHGHGHHRGHGG
ncbi:MAG TPA: hypothetical protein VFF02_10320 [Anaeromyxobacteraceae bacterium]|nr:hypothetical protein [Anaeromyxobacteraceae bacterium]